MRIFSILGFALMPFVAGGCASPSARIASERLKFLEDPSIFTDVYSGSARGDRHYHYLAGHDPKFGDFLLTLLPSAEDVRVVVDALVFFALIERDRAKFERAVAMIKPAVLVHTVNRGSNHDLVFVPLSE